MTSTLEKKVDLLVGLMQDLREEMAKLKGRTSKDPSSKWISSTQLAEIVGLKPRTITKWIAQGVFPEDILRRKTHGASFHWRLNSEKAIEIAEQKDGGN